MKKVLGYLRRASDEFGMLKDGDKIAVGISGGKDSMLLLHALFLYKKYMKLNYDLVGITVDLGFAGFETDNIKLFCKEHDVPCHIKKTQIGEIVFDIRKEKNPCSLCSKMRKGAFYSEAKALHCNKAAFAHSADDLIETLLLSLLYEGRMSTFSPVTYLTRQDITLIRPFIYLYEKDIISEVKKLNIKLSKNPCPSDGFTKRQQIKELITLLLKENPHVKKNILHAVLGASHNLWDKLSLEE
jgi:tRNA 2-thiocytidine biosynthesis protein TtcA